MSDVSREALKDAETVLRERIEQGFDYPTRKESLAALDSLLAERDALKKGLRDALQLSEQRRVKLVALRAAHAKLLDDLAALASVGETGSQ